MGIMSILFGGSKNKQVSSSSSTGMNESYNQAYPALMGQYGTGAGTFNASDSALGDVLGKGFQGYKDSIGYDYALGEGRNDIFGKYAGRGVFQSGSLGKRLLEHSEGMRQNAFGGYLDSLFKRAGLGLGVGQLVGGAGGASYGTSNSTSSGSGSGSSSNGGLMNIAAALLSDERLKQNIEYVGTVQGVKFYSFEYIDGSGPYVGVMAQDVAKDFPEALGPEFEGYMTVDFDKLVELVGD